MYIKNSSALVENGRTRAEKIARRVSLEAAEAGLRAVEPSRLMRSKVRITGRQLVAGGNRVDLSKFNRVLVIGGGKASLAMAESLVKILGDEITAGVVNVLDSQPYGSRRRGRISLHEATHPLPSEKGREGVLEMLDLVGKPDRETLVVALISGGGSSMLPLPAKGLELADEVEVTKCLLKSGATIQELNTVRKHISATKGGRLAERLYPGTVLALVISDVVGNRLDSIASGPLYPDPSTFGDAERILRRYGAWDAAPAAVRREIKRGLAGRIPETPKPGSKYFAKVSNVIIGSNEDACGAAARRLARLGYNTEVLTTSFEGEARSAGIFMGSVVRYAGVKPRPRAYVAGGETTVTVRGEGRGGRNQEFALGASMKIGGNGGVAMLALGTDGLDGSTDAAGGLVDGYTTQRAAEAGVSSEESLLRNDSYRFFESLADLVITGPTGTNVNDLAIAVLV